MPSSTGPQPFSPRIQARGARRSRGASGRADRPADIDDFQDLERVVRRALPARFGALEVSDETLLADIDTVIDWFETRAAA